MRFLPVARGARLPVLPALGALGALLLAPSLAVPAHAGEPRVVVSAAPAAAHAARAAVDASGRVVLLERPLPYYYRYYREHSPGYPVLLQGVPVPVFSTSRPVIHRRVALVRGASAHVAWCRAHYRSYRVGDDSFQPFDGPRRRCRSPYG